MRSANNDLPNKIRIARQYWRTSTLREALAQPFHCDLPTNKKEKKSPWTLSYTARANRTGIDKATTPTTVANASQLSPQRNLHLTKKTQCVVQILTFKSHACWCISSNAVCQQWLAKHNRNRNYSALLYYFFSNLLFSTLLCLYPFSTSTLLYSTLLYYILFYSSILYSALLYSFLLYAALLDLWSARMWLHDFLTQVPTGHNDLWAGENVKVRNSEFPPWNFLCLCESSIM